MLLKAEGISKQYLRENGNSNIFFSVRETDFELPASALTVLEGRSGSGKTTLLNMLAGLLSPSKGRVTLDGTDLYGMNDRELSLFRNRHFGIIPQGQTAISTLTVLENVILPASLSGNTPGLSSRAARLLERMGIGHLKNVFPRELSGGELRRVSIARALINEPEVIFADEPTSDLDDENTALVFRILRELAGDGKAVLAVTHERDAGKYADRMFQMRSGRLGEAVLT
ncbi:MAG: ABC transporter ATP-binding protein [Oscillospiraceae bacterium]|nr:ABC transporter ATP-binding protein [Oscillospiraceae bacterium]